MTDENIEFPILDFTEDRLVDGDTRALVTKINNQQLKLETWSVGANALRQIQYDTTALPLSGGTLIGKIYGPQTDLTDPANTVVTKSLVDYHANRAVTTTQAQTIHGVKTFESDIVFNGLVTISDALIKSAQELDVGSSIVVLNSDETGSPTVDAGIEIERGNQTNARLVWDEGTDRWQAGLNNNLKNIAVEGDYVNITTAQTVTGAKTFTNNTTFKASIAVDGIGTDDSAFIFSTAPIRYSAAASSSVNNDNELINKGYVDDNFIPVAGNSTKTGNLTLEQATYSCDLIIDTKTAGNSRVRFFRDGASESELASLTNRLLITHGLNSFHLYDDYTFVNKRFDSSRLTVSSDSNGTLTTKSYVDAADNLKFDKTGGTITGNTTLSNNNPYLSINSTDSGNAHFEFKNEGTRSALIYSSAASTSFRRYDGGTPLANFTLFDNLATLDVALRTPSTLASDVGTTLTTKDYVDSVASGGSGSGSFVDTSSNQTIGGQKTFTSETVVQNPFLRVKDQSPWLSVVGTTPGHVGNQHLQFKSTDSNGDDNLSALIFQEGTSNSFRIRKYNRENGTGIQTELIFYNSFIQSQSPIRLNATPEDRDDAVLRRIDADNRYALAGSTGSGGLSQDVHGTVNLPAKSSTQGSAIRLYESTGGDDDYVELGAHDNMTDHYRLQFPRLKPTATDQALVVESINAGVITLKWA